MNVTFYCREINFTASIGLDADVVEVQKVASDFARKEMYPNMGKWDKEVPVTNQIGPDNYGFNMAMESLNGGRVNIASCSLGAAQQSLDLAIAHLKVRKQFGKRLADFQWNQFKLAELATKLHTSRLIVRDATRHLDANNIHKASLCAMAKFHATENCSQVVNQALQMFGGYGFLKDYPLQQYLRDIRVHEILEGTNEIMRLIIGRDLLSNETFGST
ncbi:acyl-CoA dehydrogenase protein [Necator americanus]|uniref:Acyl-CoA dehydrogenase protein n=1 Tax=Necator americanus TaxID=51031 RepID=W2TI48_NECAM|nr:acyl-CoA dehydrogenase protein [Necator americanus]ETN81750.1 acyl-CoA dehydrogenase protein [Necator americanus]